MGQEGSKGTKGGAPVQGSPSQPPASPTPSSPDTPSATYSSPKPLPESAIMQTPPAAADSTTNTSVRDEKSEKGRKTAFLGMSKFTPPWGKKKDKDASSASDSASDATGDVVIVTEGASGSAEALDPLLQQLAQLPKFQALQKESNKEWKEKLMFWDKSRQQSSISSLLMDPSALDEMTAVLHEHFRKSARTLAANQDLIARKVRFTDTVMKDSADAFVDRVRTLRRVVEPARNTQELATQIQNLVSRVDECRKMTDALFALLPEELQRELGPRPSLELGFATVPQTPQKVRKLHEDLLASDTAPLLLPDELKDTEDSGSVTAPSEGDIDQYFTERPLAEDDDMRSMSDNTSQRDGASSPAMQMYDEEPGNVVAELSTTGDDQMHEGHQQEHLPKQDRQEHVQAEDQLALASVTNVESEMPVAEISSSHHPETLAAVDGDVPSMREETSATETFEVAVVAETRSVNETAPGQEEDGNIKPAVDDVMSADLGTAAEVINVQNALTDSNAPESVVEPASAGNNGASEEKGVSLPIQSSPEVVADGLLSGTTGEVHEVAQTPASNDADEAEAEAEEESANDQASESKNKKKKRNKKR